ncbi:hypothetical protein COCNU_06G005130 [Cocos nucifera]|uniref:Uncharacterized protein n=1 Tax=Cocos nucifera TaxID=13894 RepID=A0A8K0IAE0_COCNU|nr:hypothetical protein COCNU_06G005130 [Cocos nucifera]
MATERSSSEEWGQGISIALPFPLPVANPLVPPEALIFWAIAVAGIPIAELPYGKYDSELIPAVVLFRDRPEAYEALVAARLFATLGSGVAILHHEGCSTYAERCRWAAVAVVVLCVWWAMAGTWVTVCPEERWARWRMVKMVFLVLGMGTL